MKKSEFYVLIMTFLMSIFLFLIATKSGLLLTHDSHAYLKLAQNSTFQNLINAFWTPLYPFLLSFGEVFNILVFAKIFHLFCLLVITLQTFLINKRHIRTLILRYFVLFMVIFSVGHLQNAVFLWSELFFVILLLQIFILINQQNSNSKIVVLLVFLSNLLCFQRLAGIIFVGLFFIMILFQQRRNIQNTSKAIIYLFFSLSGIFFWFFLKKYYQNIPQLAENHVLEIFLTNISSCFLVMLEWFLPRFLLDFLPNSAKIMVSFLLILGMIGAMIILIIKKRNKLIMNIVIMVFGYIFGICFLTLDIPSETDRYISVVQILFFVGLGASLDFFWEQTNLVFKRILLVLMILTLSYNVIRTSKNVLFWSETNQLLESLRLSKS